MKLVSFTTAALMAGTITSFAADLVEPSAPVEPPVVQAPSTQSEAFNYLALRGGGSWFDDTSFRVEDGTIDSVSNTFDDPAAYYSFAIGRDFGQVRAELEISYAQAGIDTHSAALTSGGVVGFDNADSFGKANVRTAMASAYYDFDFGSIKPFAGAGFGVAVVDVNGFGVTGLPDLLNDRDRGMAWQVTAGIGYELMEGLDVEVGYRYQDVLGIELEGPVKQDFGLSTHTIFAGLRVAL